MISIQRRFQILRCVRRALIFVLGLGAIGCAGTVVERTGTHSDRLMPTRTASCQPETDQPVEFLSGRSPIYPVKRLLAGETGYAQISFELDERGIPFNIDNHESSHPSFYAHTKEAMTGWKFTPPQIEGSYAKVTCRLRQKFGFR